jgi:hypothetical protein
MIIAMPINNTVIPIINIAMRRAYLNIIKNRSVLPTCTFGVE